MNAAVDPVFWDRLAEDYSKQPIEDPDAGGPVTLVGLDLPDDILKKLYLDNAVEFFRLDP